jgi:hypothetical protein
MSALGSDMMLEGVFVFVLVVVIARLIFKSGENGPAPWGQGTWW